MVAGVAGRTARRATTALVLGAVVTLGLAPAAALGSSPAKAGDAATTLANRYSPVVRLVDRSGSCGNDDALRPTNVNAVLDNREMALRGPWDTTNIVTVGPTAKELSEGLDGYNLDFPGSALSPGCTYADWARRIAKTSIPTVYAHIATQPDAPGKLSLQYWFFYIFNDWNNKHEGDWEMVQLNFRAANAEQALATPPYEVGYSQHESAERAKWGDSKLQIVDGTHPVVYPSVGSHANYYDSSLYLGRSAAEGVGCDDTVGPTQTIRPDVVVVPQTDYVGEFPWLGFHGRWGERQRAFYNGPTGPNEKTSWTAPISTADNTWRNTSYAIPDGDQLGRTTVSFFCSAVGAGSNLLTTIVGDPSPSLVVLAIVVVMLLWLASRTRWTPATAFRVRRRRAWGSLITTAFRMYTAHPRLFLGIGLVFIPVGLVTAGIQYLLFRVGFLAPLVDSVGASNAFVEILVFALSVFLTLVALTIVQAATAVAVTELDASHPISARAAYRLGLRRIRPLMLSLLMVIVCVALLDLTLIGAVVSVWLVVRWSLLAQASALPDSDVGPLRHSARLTKRHWWKTASVSGLVVGLGLLIGPAVGAVLLIITNASFDFVDVIAAVVNVVVLPYVAITTTYLYYDLDVRRLLAGPKPTTVTELPAEA
jgi:hypothetical protein